MNSDYLKNLKCKKLSEEQKGQLEERISIIEIQEAIKSMKKDKSPGNDGLPIEWYRTFWPDIKFLFLDVIREVALYGLPESSRKGIITLLEKPGRDLNYLKNWRPLSLLNCDGKVYAQNTI